MNSALSILASAILLASAVAAQPRTPAKTVKLFNGRDLTGFYVSMKENKLTDPKGVFTVKDGAIHVSGEEWGGLTTVEEWTNYHLVAEWKWGGKNWPPRAGKTRDSGILIHGAGADGAAGSGWLESIEYQIIEGGTGDMILVRGKTRPSATAEVEKGENNQTYWKKGGEKVTRDSGRFNWYGRDRAWQDKLGYRGPVDVEKPVGQWNKSEIIARGDTLKYYLNGKLVLETTAVRPTAGKIQIQSEAAEILIRKLELRPLR
jgi:hypothetical protein